MAGRDLHNNVKFSRAISPIAATTDNTAFVSEILDTANFDQNEFVMLAGSLADVDATFTILAEEGAASNLSDNTAVADADLIGVEAGMLLFSSDNKTSKIGYIGTKRYFRVTVTPAANTGNIFLAAVFAQCGGRTSPQSTQIN